MLTQSVYVHFAGHSGCVLQGHNAYKNHCDCANLTTAKKTQGTPVVFDGAMGSTLYEQGILHTRAFEECNLTAAAKVKAVHLAFIEAGANVIE